MAAVGGLPTFAEAKVTDGVAPEADTLVLIHPVTESSYDDHAKYAIWIGRPMALKTTGLRVTARSSIQARPVDGLYKL